MTDVTLPNFSSGQIRVSPAALLQSERGCSVFSGGFVLSSVGYLRQPAPGTQSGTSRALNYAALAVRKGKERVRGRFLNSPR